MRKSLLQTIFVRPNFDKSKRRMLSFFFTLSIQVKKNIPGGFPCLMCKAKMKSSKDNFTKIFDSLDYTKECNQLLPKNMKMCKNDAKLIFKTFFKLADIQDLCSVVKMCPAPNQTSVSKDKNLITKEELRSKKYTESCSMMKDLINYLMHKGLDEYTIPSIVDSIKRVSEDNSLAKFISSKINQPAMRAIATKLSSTYSSDELAQFAGVCGEL